MKNLGEESDRLFAQVYSTIEKEKETKLAGEVYQDSLQENELNNSVNYESDMQDTQRHETEPSVAEYGVEKTTRISETQVTNQPKNKVCYFYKNNMCKFGKKGRDCPYNHPKLCYKYKVNGCDPVNGCKQGDNCRFLHPRICYGSMRKRECFNLECKRLHLKGTRRYQYENPTSEQQQHPQHHRHHQQQQQQQQQRQQQQLHQLPHWQQLQQQQHLQGQIQHQNQKDSTVSFLLIQQMQQMQQTQQQMLQMLKTLPWQWTATAPQQGYQHQAAMTIPFTK